MARPCVCGGCNENCCWCYGTGVVSDKFSRGGGQDPWYGDGDGNPWYPGRRRYKRKRKAKIELADDKPATITPPPRTAPELAQPLAQKDSDTEEAKGMSVCPRCSVPVREVNLPRHMRKVHDGARILPSVRATSTGKIVPVAVFDPAALYLPEHPAALPEHPVVRRVRSFKARPTRTKRAHSAAKGMSVCPKCSVPVREVNLPRHIRKVHHTAYGTPGSGKKAKVPPGKSGRAQLFREASNSKKNNEVFQQRLERKMDATKNIGYPTREQGRYGSHPAHDAFDDESKP